MKYYVVHYSGHFGYIKPWSAVRDGLTYSQQFLTPSIVEGMEKKLFPELLPTKGIQRILRHKLTNQGLVLQQEKTQPQGWKVGKTKKMMSMERKQSVLVRGVLLQPELYLAFETLESARRASTQHLCLCRNEDLILPDPQIMEMEQEEFDALPGFELRFGRNPKEEFMVGVNRFHDNSPMYGYLEIDGSSVLSSK